MWSSEINELTEIKFHYYDHQLKNCFGVITAARILHWMIGDRDMGYRPFSEKIMPPTWLIHWLFRKRSIMNTLYFRIKINFLPPPPQFNQFAWYFLLKEKRKFLPWPCKWSFSLLKHEIWIALAIWAHTYCLHCE